MQANFQPAIAAFGLAAVLSGCGSAYSGLSDSSGLGAGQYRPAVAVEPGNEGKYEQTLPICRNVAQNRQMTAAQEAQLKTITGAAEGAGTGAAAGLEFGNILDDVGFETSAGEGALIGAAAGAVSGLASAFASGAEETAKETRRVLLNCLKRYSRGGTLWKVVE